MAKRKLKRYRMEIATVKHALTNQRPRFWKTISVRTHEMAKQLRYLLRKFGMAHRVEEIPPLPKGKPGRPKNTAEK